MPTYKDANHLAGSAWAQANRRLGISWPGELGGMMMVMIDDDLAGSAWAEANRRLGMTWPGELGVNDDDDDDGG